MRILLGSGGLSTDARKEIWRQALDAFLGPIQRVLFVPYAIKNHDYYVQRMQELNLAAGRTIVGIHREANPHAAVEQAPAIYIGGGNTFLLLRTLQQQRLLEPIARRVRAGTPYVGISAGSNVACPTICTTNDMPVVAPDGLKALGLVPFQINPHYFSGPVYIGVGEGYIPYGGETRDDRLREFHEWNATPVIAPWEGGYVLVENGRTQVRGAAARIFLQGQPPQDVAPDSEIDALLA